MCLCSCAPVGGRCYTHLLHIDAHQLPHHILKPVEGQGQGIFGCIGSPTLLQCHSSDILRVVKPARVLLGAHGTQDTPWSAIVCGNRCGPVSGHVQVASYSPERTAV